MASRVTAMVRPRSSAIVRISDRAWQSIVSTALYTPTKMASPPPRRFRITSPPPTSPLAYTAYLTALIGRYGPHGSFWRDNPGLPRIPIRAWQIWNEPHLGYQWSTPGQAEDWAVRYALLLRLSHDAVKAADPGALVG